MDTKFAATFVPDLAIAAAALKVPGVVVAEGFTGVVGAALEGGCSSITAGLALPDDVHRRCAGSNCSRCRGAALRH